MFLLQFLDSCLAPTYVDVWVWVQATHPLYEESQQRPKNWRRRNHKMRGIKSQRGKVWNLYAIFGVFCTRLSSSYLHILLPRGSKHYNLQPIWMGMDIMFVFLVSCAFCRPHRTFAYFFLAADKNQPLKRLKKPIWLVWISYFSFVFLTCVLTQNKAMTSRRYPCTTAQCAN